MKLLPPLTKLTPPPLPHLLHIPPPLRRWAPMATALPLRRDKVVVIMGATGAGKSQLSVDLATTLFPSSEVVNADKMQVYSGLDITTNKIPPRDRLGVPHHLIGSVAAGDFTPSDFRALGKSAIDGVVSRRNLPLIAGGSNSFIYALLADEFDPGADVFSGFGPVMSRELRFDCCFLWVDVSFPVLDDYLRRRVDDMLDSGMFEELVEYYYDGPGGRERAGLGKAIGVPEFERCFRRHPPPRRRDAWRGMEPRRRAALYGEAVREIKDNTCQLAKRQVGKILRLKEDGGWDLRRVDATEALRAAMAAEGGPGKGRKWAGIWERDVVGPSAKIVKRFLEEE